MAEVFKRLRKANISAALSTLANYSANTSTKVLIIGFSACNTSNSAVTFDIGTNDGSSTVYIVKNAPIPVGGSLIVSDNQKIVMQPSDVIKTKASANSSIDVIVSVLEIT